MNPLAGTWEMDTRTVYARAAMAAFLTVSAYYTMEALADGSLEATVAALAFVVGFIALAYYGSSAADRALLWWHTRGYGGEDGGR